MRKKFPAYQQLDTMDCGPTCLRIVAQYYGRSFTLRYLRSLCETTREGSSLLGLSRAAEQIGLKSTGVKLDLEQLTTVQLPLILFVKQSHFVVLYKIKKGKYYVSDPQKGLEILTNDELLEDWIGPNTSEEDLGIAMLFEPTNTFLSSKDDFAEELQENGKVRLLNYIFRYKKMIFQLLLGVLAEGCLQVVFPILTQKLVDVGIKNSSMQFIYLILLFQLLLVFGRTFSELVKNWVMLHLSTRINLSLVSDFFIKMMRLPIGYFDTRLTGDLIQRIRDHDRIETLLTSESLNISFASINLIAFGALLAYYNMFIFGIFMLGSLIFVGWIFLFIKQRKKIDHQLFELNSKENSKVMELVNGMQEIKLHNVENQMRWSWEFIKARLFKINMKYLALTEKQNVGGVTINEVKNIIITVVAAHLVITGGLSLGAMLAISYIVGQLSNPIRDIVNFIHSYQLAMLSLERINEIHQREVEAKGKFLDQIPDFESIRVSNVSFRYSGALEPTLMDLNFEIPRGKTTAIVGASGSGKTTLMKLLLKFYEPTSGEVKVGEVNMNNISHTSWRDHCGVVMQEGFIFDNTIAFNIAVKNEQLFAKNIARAAQLAEIKSFIEEKPLGYNTKIGSEGLNISTGQKQRILIARAIYKNPEMVFFDEATSALDANNEKKITRNLDTFLADRTAVVIAHRLSTVRNADNILVMDKGRIIEQGNHEELVARQGIYFNLVKNQLELEEIPEYYG